MPYYQGKEVTVKPLPEDDPRHEGNPNELVIITDANGAEKIVNASEVTATAVPPEAKPHKPAEAKK